MLLPAGNHPGNFLGHLSSAATGAEWVRLASVPRLTRLAPGNLPIISEPIQTGPRLAQQVAVVLPVLGSSATAGTHPLPAGAAILQPGQAANSQPASKIFGSWKDVRKGRAVRSGDDTRLHPVPRLSVVLTLSKPRQSDGGSVRSARCRGPM